MVSWLAIIFMIMNMILGVAIPLGLMLYLKKKYQLSVMPFWIGIAAMVLFAFVLEQMVHFVFLQSPVGKAVRENFALFAVYGGLMAGIFEECGRFIAMKFALKKKHGDAHNAIMYGAGHGGIEMFIILVFGMINNVIYSLMLNLGQAETLLAPLDPANREIAQNAFDTLVATSPFLFLASPIERILALTGQIALSVIVWFAVTKKKKGYLLVVAIFLHMILDTSAVWLAQIGVPVLVVELEVLAVVVLIALCARSIWKKENH